MKESRFAALFCYSSGRRLNLNNRVHPPARIVPQRNGCCLRHRELP